MIQNSFFDYIKIRVGITALRLIAPFSIAYLFSCAFRRDIFVLPLALFAGAEASFYLLVYLPRRSRLQAAPTHSPPILTRGERELLFERCFRAGSSSVSDPGNNPPYPTGWFLPANSIPNREDAIEWLLWALFSSTLKEVDYEEHREELGEYIKKIEHAIGRELENGHSTDNRMRSMRITLDPVVMLHRPLIWYFIVASVDAYTCLFLLYLGFKHYSPSEPQWRRCFPPRPIAFLVSNAAPEGVKVPYWYRPHKSNTKLPFVFLHGIGIGLYPYVPFLKSIINQNRDVGILLPEMLSISMHMTPHSVPPRVEMLQSLNTILETLRFRNDDEETLLSAPTSTNASERQPVLNEEEPAAEPSGHGWDSVVLCAHSYGTFVAGWIIREDVDKNLVSSTSDQTVSLSPPPTLASKIAHIILVDPIPILISNPTVAHNFLYREPWTVCPHRLGSKVSYPELEVDLRGSPLPLPIPCSTSAPHQNRNICHPNPFPTSSPNHTSKDLALKCRKDKWYTYSSAAAWQLWYFASRDADVARTLFRSFFWAEGGIWKEEIAQFIGRPRSSTGTTTKNMTIVLGGMDQIVPSEAIRLYLTGEERWKARWTGRLLVDGGMSPNRDASLRTANSASFKDFEAQRDRDVVSGEGGGGTLEVLFNPKLDHAVIFDAEKWTEPLVEVVGRYVRSSMP